MKTFKLKSILKNKITRYFLYIIVEFSLIVLGILVAIYINNNNANNQYKKQIDNNLLRVYSELEYNIKETKEAILKIREKDSLIYLVMNDSIKPEMYYNDLNLAYLILFFHNLNLEDKSYQNLLSISVSDNRYKEELLSSLKDLYSMNKNIEQINDRMSTFVYDKSLPLLAQNTKSFGDLTYKGHVKEDVVEYFTNSDEYKSYVSQYAIIAIKNQLRYNQNFLKKAYKISSEIAQEYNLDNEYLILQDTLISQYSGSYLNSQSADTLTIKLANDSLILYRNEDFRLNLVPITQDIYITDNEGGGYFVSFSKVEETINLKLNLLSINYSYEKIE